jgi:hypothetical protein
VRTVVPFSDVGEPKAAKSCVPRKSSAFCLRHLHPALATRHANRSRNGSRIWFAKQPVAVRPRNGIETRMKIRERRAQAFYSQVRRKFRIERLEQRSAECAHSKSNAATCPLAWTPASVLPAIKILTFQTSRYCEELFQLALHRSGVRLSLAAGKPGAVVGKDHLVTCHIAISL